MLSRLEKRGVDELALDDELALLLALPLPDDVLEDALLPDDDAVADDGALDEAELDALGLELKLVDVDSCGDELAELYSTYPLSANP